MDDTTQAPPESEEPRHYIVQSDDDDRTDVGLITVRYKSRNEHWVKFPDGQFRTRYNSKRIDKTDMDLLDAFETMPRLKVSYRPITKFFKDNNGGFYLISFLILVLYVICGLIMMIATQFGFAEVILDSIVIDYIFVALLIALPVSILWTYLSNRAERTWRNLTPDDLYCNTKQELERKEKKEQEANGHRGTGRIG